jgi:uncharacterized protein (DUF1015 family)
MPVRLFYPFAGLRPEASHAADVVAPPYDVLNAAEARQRAQGKPYSFLHISKAEIDLPDSVDPYSEVVYQQAAKNLKALCEKGVLVREASPCYYAYRLIQGEHQQTGIVFAASVAAYNQGLIKRHEFTRPQKEDDRVRQIEALNAQTGPALLAYASHAAADAEILRHTQAAPMLDVLADDGVRHQIWRIAGAEALARLEQAFANVQAFYIADGHHRSAAAARVTASRNAGDDVGSGRFLATAFPHNQMKILDYNRVIRDLNSFNKETLLQKLATDFSIKSCGKTPAKPQKMGEFGMYLNGEWYLLTINTALAKQPNPIDALDVSLLQNYIIKPLFGISDPRRDERIDFVGGGRGLAELARRVDSGEMAVAFCLYPTAMEQLMAVADQGEVMPPKSTWFEPKLADGLLSHVLD